MAESVKRIFIVLKNPEWDGLKPSKIHLFNKAYLNDGSERLINDVANEALEYMQKHLYYDEEFPFFYWTYEPKGSFIDVWVTPDLLSDTRAFTDFKAWLTKTATAWATNNKLPVKVEGDKPREFILKFTFNLPVTATT